MTKAFNCIVLFFLFQPAIAATLIMPKDLVDIAEQNGCEQISNFFERPGQVDPPYVYGYLPGDPENSAVFWCKKKPGVSTDKPYLLLFASLGSTTPLECPSQIEWWNPPAGLSIYRAGDLSLEDFHYIENPKKSGPKKTLARGPVVLSSYDGLEEYFYCYNKKWLYKMLD